MKKCTQLHKVISALISFILLTEFTGCYSARIISTSNISSSEKYLIHYRNSLLSVDNASISDGIFSCRLDFSDNNKNKAYKTHIYLVNDSALKTDNELIYLSAGNIARVERMVPDPKKTRTLTTVLIITACVGVAVGVTVFIFSRVAHGVEKTSTSIDSLMDYCVDIELCGDTSPD